jgi:cytochrome c oxidase subunit 3
MSEACMSKHANIDASQLPDYSSGIKAPIWWGIVGLITVEMTVFATLIASFFYIQSNHVVWPPSGTSPPGLLLPTIATLVLVASVIPIYFADKAIQKGNAEPLKTLPLVSVVLALGFLLIKAYEYSHIGFRWDTHSYGSLVWTMMGFHTAHVLAVILKTFVLIYLARRNYFNFERRIAVTVNGIYWYFVAIVWMPLYLTIYFGSRIWNA